MKAISLRQPWAWLVVNGHKNVENRTWATSFRGPVLIHAARRWGREERVNLEMVRREFGIDVPDDLHLGGIVGKANVTDCVGRSESPWFFGPWGFVLRDAGRIPFLPCKGALGFFSISALTCSR